MPVLNHASQDSLRTLAKNIETARIRRGMTRKLLSESALITVQTYGRLIKGDDGVTLGVLFRVASALNIESLLGNLLDPDLDTVGKELEALSGGPRQLIDESPEFSHLSEKP